MIHAPQGGAPHAALPPQEPLCRTWKSRVRQHRDDPIVCLERRAVERAAPSTAGGHMVTVDDTPLCGRGPFTVFLLGQWFGSILIPGCQRMMMVT